MPPFYDPVKHQRCSIRLAGYDYTRIGAYFVTICTQGKACLFGDVINGMMRLNRVGRVVWEVWNALPTHYQNIGLDTWVIMPNHFHGIVLIVDYTTDHVGAGLKPALVSQPHTCREIYPPGQTPSPTQMDPHESDNTHMTEPKDHDVSNPMARAGLKPAPTKTHGLPEIIRAFKTFSARRINTIGATPGKPVWQRNYHERIIRDDDEHERIRQYIVDNPSRWNRDCTYNV